MTRLERLAPDPETGRARWLLHLQPIEDSILTHLPDQIETLLGNPDANQRVIDRLFPVSYSDADEERRNRELLGATLLDDRRELVDAMRRELADAERTTTETRLTLTAEGIDRLLRFVNDVRLVLATDLGIDENLGEHSIESKDPDAPKYALLEYLSQVEVILVDALAESP